MELAGQSVAHIVYAHLKPGDSVVVICGPGSLVLLLFVNVF